MRRRPASTTATHSRLRAAAAACLLALGLTASARSEDAPAPAPKGPVIHLTNGGHVPGDLKDSADPKVLRWQGSAFVAPFDFSLGAINSVHYPSPAELPKPAGDYCFELAGGDVLFGRLVGLDDKEAELDVARIGRLHLDRSAIRRIYRWRDSADLIYLGPNGLAGWKETSTPKGWREESGQLVTSQDAATIRGDLGLPPRAVVEFEVSWKTKPDFVLAFGVGDDEKTLARAFRIEVWEGDIVVHRETEREADVASIQALPTGSGPGRAHLLAYIDQELGRVLVVSTTGKQLADLKVTGPAIQAFPGVVMTNKRGDVRLERLRIGLWNGEAPREAQADKSRIHRVDGSIVYGQVARFDAAKGEFVVRDGQGESRVAEAQIAGVFLSQPDESDDKPRAIRAVYQDGARLSGELIKVEKGDLYLKVPGIKEEPRLPLAGLGSLAVLRHDAKPDGKEKEDSKVGMLELDGVRLRGRLVDGVEGAGASCFAWLPLESTTSSPLRPGASGRVVYREPPPPPKPDPQQVQNQAQIRRMQIVAPRPVGIRDRAINATAGNSTSTTSQTDRRAIHLRTGDIIPSEVTRIDETGVTFKSPISDSTFVPNEKVKAVELARELPTTIKINKTKRERLLTLPRLQKDSPPTHMIRSKNGDYLRGRIVGMDAEKLQVELHLEARDVPRDRIARIIWLHADETDPSKAAPKAAGANVATRVQALKTDGVRLTFTPEKMEGSTLSGKSDVLGVCRVRLEEVDQLLLGGNIEQAASQLEYGQWKLHPAEEPKVSQDDDSPTGRTPGTESMLVGKAAPDFELELLGGEKFQLAKSKGKVVVLDFWATWCGPCLQAMPQVDRVTRELKDQGVQLVAVNLQESPRDIKAMMERHKLDMTVALDRDGVVAAKYAANAIPQTVIIDRDGNISRLFIGGGPHFDDQLRDALKAVLAGEKPKDASK
jgi:peroxiredoxin